tara:strand:- start:7545 stop:8312 length:768 start_codon:yes stop_codon:yes gene_type:complete
LAKIKTELKEMKKVIIIFLFTTIVLQSCSPKIRTNLSTETHKPLDSETEILILNFNENIPDNSTYIGELKIGDSGFSTDCGYNTVINEAKETAKKSGANIVYLTEIKNPTFESTCYRIKANLYRNFNSEVLSKISENKKLKNKSRLTLDADYAVIYFYRPKIFTGSAIGIKVRMDDKTVIGKVRNGEKFEYKITDYGKHEFWGNTESRKSIIIDIQKGQEYFVRCGINMGITVGIPEMYLVENELGISEYESLKK